MKKLIHRCIVCRRLEGKPLIGPSPPPLPDFRVDQEPPFTFTGVDFAGPLHIKTGNAVLESKVWICLYTCCVTRAVHLEVVSDLTTAAFLRSLKRFAARRGLPRRFVSDNGKTFKAAAKTLKATRGCAMLLGRYASMSSNAINIYGSSVCIYSYPLMSHTHG